ncbi:MAG TPA: tripartite tricarboxylate transporter substrate binding protein [Burkholderiales bacterium]|nr:tripartite tricarboxylate transporter substrate binding protein [Burkholderiales bacterium]
MRCLFVAIFVLISSYAIAQDYPSHPVRIVVSQGPGSSTDIQARLLAEKMSQAWGEQVYIENKVGANGIIGMQELAKSKPDGYSLGTASPSALTYNQFIYKDLPYRPSEDYVPITQISTLTFVLAVNPKLSVKSVAELVALAKSKPDELTYSSPGIGNLSHLGTELFAAETGIKVRHIPNKGDAPALTDVISGNTDFIINTLPSMLPHIMSGRLRALAVAGSSRSSALPGVPTIAESGYPRVLVEGWVGMVAPAGTPPSIVAKVQQEVAQQLSTPELKEALAKQGSNAVGSSPEAFAAFVKSESSKWKRVIETAKMQPQ